MVKKLIIITLTICTLPTFAAAGKYIARVNGDGDILFERDSGFSADIREVEISDLDGSIYISFSTSAANLRKFDENGNYDGGFEAEGLEDSAGFDIDDENYLWVTGDRYSRAWGLYKFTSSGGYIDGLDDFIPRDAAYNGDYHVWAGDHAPSSDMNGMHKIDSNVDRVLYRDGYEPYYLTCDKVSRNVWFMDIVGSRSKLVKLDNNGDELVYLMGTGVSDPQASPVDGGCWFIGGGGLIKVDTYGSIVFHDGSFSDIAAIDVNESDGSVWVASNIPKRLVHLDKDGNRLLYKEWPGGDFAHLAVDQRNGTCIVIYEEYKSGRSGLNIQPASVGRIKAMYAE